MKFIENFLQIVFILNICFIFIHSDRRDLLGYDPESWGGLVSKKKRIEELDILLQFPIWWRWLWSFVISSVKSLGSQVVNGTLEIPCQNVCLFWILWNCCLIFFCHFACLIYNENGSIWNSIYRFLNSKSFI